MNGFSRAVRELIGLFVDDGKLALTLVALLLAVGLLTHFGALDGSLALLLLVGGTLLALLLNVLRATALSGR
jgi:hypothetical protein